MVVSVYVHMRAHDEVRIGWVRIRAQCVKSFTKSTSAATSLVIITSMPVGTIPLHDNHISVSVHRCLLSTHVGLSRHHSCPGPSTRHLDHASPGACARARMWQPVCVNLHSFTPWVPTVYSSKLPKIYTKLQNSRSNRCPDTETPSL